MRVLAISGSMRLNSSNTYLLRHIAEVAKPEFECEIANGLDSLPVFSPDLEGSLTPSSVRNFASAVALSDGIIISSPEYVRAIPGGLKNAIDWLVSRDEIIRKPIALAHASHRGDDMLNSLRTVLATVSENFSESCFLRIPLVSQTADEMGTTVSKDENAAAIRTFVDSYKDYVMSCQ